jgi:hypothetical protein
MVLGTLSARSTFGQQLLGGFENTLVSTAGGTPFGGQWTASPEYSPIGATEGSSALVVRHNPSWVTDGLFLKAGMALAQQVSQHDFLAIDLTTSDLGVAADGISPAWRQVFIVFNASPAHGGWQQTQVDFPVAADDGNSFTYTAILDLATSGIKANAQNFVNTGGGEGTWWELFLVFQGGNQGVAPKPGDYDNNGVVDASDYVIWRKTLSGTSLPNETVSPGIIDSADYEEWRRLYGSDYTKIATTIDNIRFANAGSGSGLSPGGIPEPSSGLLALVAALLFAARRVRL